MLEVEFTSPRSRMASRSGQNVPRPNIYVVKTSKTKQDTAMVTSERQ